MGPELQNSFEEGSSGKLYSKLTVRHHVFRIYVTPNHTRLVSRTKMNLKRTSPRASRSSSLLNSFDYHENLVLQNMKFKKYKELGKTKPWQSLVWISAASILQAWNQRYDWSRYLLACLVKLPHKCAERCHEARKGWMLWQVAALVLGLSITSEVQSQKEKLNFKMTHHRNEG